MDISGQIFISMTNKMETALGPGTRSFLHRYQLLRGQTDNMESLVRDVLEYCHLVENELLHSESSNKYLQKQVLDSEFLVAQRLDVFKYRNPYIVVLIDGDGLIFRENWIQQGIEGGKKAAYALRSAIMERFSKEAKNLEIVAKVVANLAGLAKAMQRDGSLGNQSDLKDFSLGFTQAKASFDFVDVGYGKERADTKIRETTRWHLKNINCEHVLLGISHDSGYAPFLDDLLHDEEVRERISIIQGVTAVPEILATKAKVEDLGHDLFRNDKLVDKIQTYTRHSPPAPAPASIVAPVTTPQPVPGTISISRTASPATSISSSQARTPSASYATIASSASPPPPQITLPLPLKTPTSCQKTQTQSQVLASQFQVIPPNMPDDWCPGPRGVDEPIRVNTQALEAVKKRKDSDKLCNNHYLRGPCAKIDHCPFVHDYKASEQEIKAIAVLARQNPCTAGQYCDMDDCIYGHHCSSFRDGMCLQVHCKFPAKFHPPGTKCRTTILHLN